jgi:TRAP-type C4-dicarboxylate transport system permease small subunit
MNFSAALQRMARIVAWATAFVGSISLLLMMIQTVLDIALTAIFNHPIEGNLEIISFYHMVFVVFLPLALVELNHEHIHVDLFITPLPRRYQNIVYIFANSVAAIFLGMLSYRTSLDAIESTRISDVVMGSTLVVTWPARWALPIGFAAMILALIANIAAALRDLDHYEPMPASPEIGD